MIARPGVLQHLVRLLPDLAAIVAQFLEASEAAVLTKAGRARVMYAGALGDVAAEPDLIRRTEAFCAKVPELGSPGALLSRLARLVERAWEHEDGRSHRRPDVLSIVCQLLARPEHPFTYHVVRYAIVQSLRAVYRIRFDTESVNNLRETYDGIKARFSEQQRRRIRRNSSPLEHFLIDLLALSGSVYRALSADNLSSYYHAFSSQPLGVDVAKRQRHFSLSQDWPELHGAPPDFPSVLNLAFGHPLCIPGLDEVLGGMIPALPATSEVTGGQVTLVAGAPGSGKTTLCLSIASRLAELGATVRYVATEEDAPGLDLKLAMIGGENYLARALWGDAAVGFSKDFDVVQGGAFGTLAELAAQLEAELADTAVHSNGIENPVYPLYARAVVIDSLSILLHPQLNEGRSESDLRRNLGTILLRLRTLGVFVLLVGGVNDYQDQGLAYIVDNVFVLGTDDQRSPQHPLRTLSINKTRLQAAHRGKHSLHLSRSEGCVVHASLHALLRMLHERPEMRPDPRRRAVIYEPRQLALPLPDATVEPGSLSIQSRSQTLVYGWGSSGKARLALALALEPRQVPSERRDQRASGVDNGRVLVISFLYGDAYYQGILDNYVARGKRFRKSRPGPRLSVLALYPGYIDAETLLGRVRRMIAGAKLEGDPFTAVVVDGIHNVLLQYPLLETEKLLWPTFFRLMRTEGLDVVSTFTFFEVPFSNDGSRRTVVDRAASLRVSQDVFFHLLVSNCDYSLAVERADADLLAVRPGASIDQTHAQPGMFFWRADEFHVDYTRRSR